MTDYSATLQADIDANIGGIVYLAAGTYEVGDIDLKGTSLIGEPGHTTLTMLDGATAMLTDTTWGSILLRDLILDGQDHSGNAIVLSANVGIQLENVSLCHWIDYVVIFGQSTLDVSVSGGRVHDISSQDVYCFQGSHSVIQNVAFRNCDEHVVRFGRFNIDPDLPSGLHGVVSGCTFYNIGNDAVLYEIDARFGSVVGNTFRLCRRAVKCEGQPVGSPDLMSRIVVDGNVFVTQINEPGEAIKGLGVKGMVVSNNIINGAAQGISVGAQSTVTGNFMEAIADYGIVVDGSDSIVSSNVIVSSGYAVKVNSGVSRAMIVNNNMHNSASTLSNSGSGTVSTGNIT